MASKTKLWGIFLILGTLACSAYENRYTEMTSALRHNAKVISQTGLQHLIEWHEIFPQKKFPFQIYGSAHNAWHSGDQFHGSTALALAGCNLSYNSPLLRRAYALGLFGGGARDRLKFSGDLLKRTRIEQGFFGYGGHFHIWGLEIATSTLLSFGSARTDLGHTSLNYQKHQCRTLHSQYTATYLWDHHAWSFGPMIGLINDHIKYHGAKDWDQQNFHASDLDGIAGLYLVHDRAKFDIRFFLGGQHNFRHREHGGALNYHGKTELPKTTKPIKNHFLLSTDFHYALASHWLLTFHLSGSYHRRDKFTATGLTLDHIF
ncbi:MAG: hypothetical protein LW808_002580 [Verrucomicrobiota bacterium]|nr:MAG: hypothetical protein LW808_002580 [Verrucomicrobiota bacterium]